MFEHLGPVPEIKTKKYTSKLKLYVSFLVAAVIVFTFSFSLRQGPSSVAQEYESLENLTVKVSGQSMDKTYVADSDNFELFNFNINADRPGIVLEQLKFAVKGLYDIEFIEDLKLYHQSVQLGDIKEVDSNGNVYFNTSDYVLPVGDNSFSLVLPKNRSIKPGNIFQISLENGISALLKYQGHMLTAKGEFPVISGSLSFVEHGSLSMVSHNDKFYRVADLPQKLFTFELDSDSEISEVRQLVIDYQSLDSKDSLDGKDFVLVLGKQALAGATVEDGQIVFDLSDPLEVADTADVELHALEMPEGEYDFYLTDWQAIGLDSDRDILLEETLFLGTVKTSPYFPEFVNGDLKNALSTGWNELYNMKLNARGQDSINLNKLTWAVSARGADLGQAEVWIDDEPYIADVILSDDKIIVKASWENPIVVGNSTDIKLLIKVDNIEKRAKIETYLLADEEPLTENNAEANILWSYQDEVYNSYGLPYLPLLPNIITK